MFQLNHFTDCWHVIWLIIQTWSSHAIDSRYSLRLWWFYFSLNSYVCYLPPTLVSASFGRNCVTRSTSLCKPSRGDQHLVRDRVCFAKPTWRVGESKCTGATFESDQMRKTFPQFHFSRRGQKLGRKKKSLTVLSPVWHSRRDTKGKRPDRSLQESDERPFLRLTSPPWQLPSLRPSPLKTSPAMMTRSSVGAWRAGARHPDLRQLDPPLPNNISIRWRRERPRWVCVQVGGCVH